MSDNQLEDEYQLLAEQISDKVSEAAKVLHEAIKMAQERGIDRLHYPRKAPGMTNEQYEFYIESLNFRELFKALNQAGWSTSSMKC